MNRILEVNVDDMGFGGVYSLVRNVILAKPAGTTLDIACIEPFEQQKNIDELADHGCTVHYVGSTTWATPATRSKSSSSSYRT